MRSPYLEALGIVHAEAPQQLKRRLIADELGDRQPAHALDNSHQRLDHELIVRRVRQSADEVAVDLQIAERQALEVLEGAEARTEVVQRDRAAERLHTCAEAPRPLHV